MKTAILNSLLIIIFTGCNTYYDESDFKNVSKIDAHIHINSDDGTFEKVASEDNFILITLNVDHPGPPDITTQLGYAELSAKRFPGRVFFGATFLFDTADWGTREWSERVIRQLEADISKGAVAVKIWKNIGMTVRDKNGSFIMVDDPDLRPLFDFIKSKNLPVSGHLGEPLNCWMPLDEMNIKSNRDYFASHPEYHMYLHPDYPSYQQQISARDNLLAINPDLQFIGCHLGSIEWDVDSLAARLDRFPNMAVDISARIAHIQYQSAENQERVRKFMIKYQDRILYGTDVGYDNGDDAMRFGKRMHETWLDDWRYLATDLEMTSSRFDGKFTGLKLPRNVIDKIYFENSVKWYKLNIN
jgi:predicted TIM-barrel fold metal-dependent hydrolase